MKLGIGKIRTIRRDNMAKDSKYEIIRAENIELSEEDKEDIKYLQELKKYEDKEDERIFEDDMSIVEEALAIEEECIKFYDKASEMLFGNAEEVFKSLSHQSEEHVSYLSGIKKTLEGYEDKSFMDKIKDFIDKKKNKDDDKYNWGEIEDYKLTAALNVFAIGMEIKRTMIEFYIKASKRAEYPYAKKLYDELLYWENYQLDQLTEQYKIYENK